jgi:prepilin-type N-terminal cleavage/methylation domain-containing protein/prepilin-type processing-associated H-X9-DG protein
MQRSGFSLIELLVAVGIIAILIAVSFPAAAGAIRHADCSGCVSHMHALGVAFLNYANDNDGQLPPRTVGSSDKWPVLLQPYLPSTKVFVDPGDPVAVAVPSDQLASNTTNHSSFFFNGFNDLGAFTNPTMTVSLANLTGPGELALLGEKVTGNTQYYMDFVEGNQDDILNKKAYFGGSNYAFVDGSVQFIPVAQYNDTIWMVDKSYVVPPVPPGH